MKTYRYALLSCLLLLSACDNLPDWLTGGDDKTPLPGKRVSVLTDVGHLKADDSLSDTKVSVPEVSNNSNWHQSGGAGAGLDGNLALSGFTHHDSVKIGDHNGWDQHLYISPVTGAGMVFAMDAKGYISAHNALTIDKINWVNKSLVDKEDNDTLGGGLAFDDGRVYATSGRGHIIAVDAASGKELWKQFLGFALRAAPKILAGKIFVLSQDNQLFALDSATGKTLWNHRGINETAGFLASVTPAVSDTIVIAPYSSGGLHALDMASGQEVWSDTLLRLRRTFATAGFSGIGGTPLIQNDIVYAVGSSGFMAAITLGTGRHIWEQDITSLNAPWLAGDFLYVLSTDNELVCLMRTDGRIKWIKPLPRYEDEKKHKGPLVWRGPVMAGGQLLVVGMHGKMLTFSPIDGATLATIEIPEKITDAPILSGGRLYLLTQDANLHAYY